MITLQFNAVIGRPDGLPRDAEAMPLWALMAPTVGDTEGLIATLPDRQPLHDSTEGHLSEQIISDLLWAVGGLHRCVTDARPETELIRSRGVRLYVAMPQGLLLYEPWLHALRLLVASDVRRVTGVPDFTDVASLDLVFVAERCKTKNVPGVNQECCAHATVRAMSQKAYQYSAAHGLGTMVRAWFERDALARSLPLRADQTMLLTQTVVAIGSTEALRRQGD